VKTKIVRTSLTPLQVEAALGRADKALAAGDSVTARQEVVRTLAVLQEARRLQDIVLDAVVAELEQRAERVIEPRHTDPESEH
jgi:hypothetical protein